MSRCPNVAPPEEIWHLLEALEAMPRANWPERWKSARNREVNVGRPFLQRADDDVKFKGRRTE